MSDMTGERSSNLPYVYYPYQTEVSETKAYTRGAFKLHKRLGDAKNALKGVRQYGEGSVRILHKWNETEEKWKPLYVFYPHDPVKW